MPKDTYSGYFILELLTQIVPNLNEEGQENTKIQNNNPHYKGVDMKEDGWSRK